MKLLIDFFQFLISLLCTAVVGLLSAGLLGIILFAIGYPLLQLIYLIGFLYKLYTYQV